MAKKARQRISYGLFPPFPLFVCIGYLDLCYHNKPRKCHESHGMWMRDPLKYLLYRVELIIDCSAPHNLIPISRMPQVC
jgi:hypothetical protein